MTTQPTTDPGQDLAPLDVLIVGAGPTGLSLAQLLAREGVRVLAISRHAGTAHTPRGHITNARTMEVLRDMGLEPAVRERATPQALMRHSLWATRLADGEELARLDSWGAGPERAADYARASPCAPCNLHQHRLEPLLLEAARAAGASVEFRQELQHFEQDDEGVSAELLDRDSGRRRRVRAHYLVGADGANSRVAEQLGVRMDDQLELGTAVSCWLEADLAPWVAHRPGALYWLSQPDPEQGLLSATFVNVVPWREWVMVFGADPAGQGREAEPEALLARARALIGDAAVPIRIRDISRWTVRRAVAACLRHGRVFLAGDAAHRHPPTNGLGTNTSIQDSFNLGWKLAWVLRGQAGEALLDSYEAERLPVARQVVHRAMQSAFEMHSMFEALGVYPGQSAADARAALDGLGAPGPEGEARRQQLEAARQLQHYQLNALGVEMGQWYERGAVAAPESPPPAQGDPQLQHTPSARVGAPLPHAWVQSQGRRISTLDLVGQGRFTLLCGSDDGPWRAAARAAAQALQLELDVVAVGPGHAVEDAQGGWARVAEALPQSAWLVRPDRHIAWRTSDARDAPARLTEAWAQVLGRRG